MLYRGFRIEMETKGSSTAFAVYETFRANWRRIGAAESAAAAEDFVDRLLLDRERLFGRARPQCR